MLYIRCLATHCSVSELSRCTTAFIAMGIGLHLMWLRCCTKPVKLLVTSVTITPFVSTLTRLCNSALIFWHIIILLAWVFHVASYFGHSVLLVNKCHLVKRCWLACYVLTRLFFKMKCANSEASSFLQRRTGIHQFFRDAVVVDGGKINSLPFGGFVYQVGRSLWCFDPFLGLNYWQIKAMFCSSASTNAWGIASTIQGRTLVPCGSHLSRKLHQCQKQVSVVGLIYYFNLTSMWHTLCINHNHMYHLNFKRVMDALNALPLQAVC